MGSRLWRACLDRRLGFARCCHQPSLSISDHAHRRRGQAQGSDAEELALKRAIATANEQITDIYDQVSKQSGKGQAAIFRAHLALLNDSEIFQEVRAQIEAGHSAAWSWQHAIERRALELKQIEMNACGAGGGSS
jgi:phosphoenolpyruvate-protein kinase (PTS system EI component)